MARVNRMVNGEIVGDEIGKYDAGMKFRPHDSITFCDQAVNEKWTIRVPTFLSEYCVWWDTWEKHRHSSMASKLKPGMVLYEVGAFDGWQAVLYGKFVGHENMVLIEPTANVWPNIKRIWEENYSSQPRGCYMGFCTDEDRGIGPVHGWPQGPDYSYFLKGVQFSKLAEDTDIPSRTIDTLMTDFGVPQAMNIDVEDVEMCVLRGAVNTLRDYRPLLWISAHNEESEKKISEFLTGFGYQCEHLGTDHERHLHFF